MSPISRATWHQSVGAVVIVWMLVAAAAVTAHRFVPEATWLMVHTFTLGVATNALFIWTNHFTTSILRSRPPRSRRGEALVLAALNVGIIATGAGMVAGHTALTGIGAGILSLAVLAHAVRLGRQLASALPARFTFAVRAYVMAAALFVPGIIAGFALSLPDLSASMSAALRGAHLSFNVLGWIGLPIIGTLLTLWPTILRTRLPEIAERAARRYLPWLAITVVGAAGGALALPLIAGTGLPSGLLVGLGVLAFVAVALAILVPLARDTQPALDTTFPALSVAAGAVWLLASLVVFGLSLIAGEAIVVLSSLGRFVLPILAGGVAQIVLGALGYLLPVVAGGGPTAVRVRNVRANAGGVWRVVLLNLALAIYVLGSVSLVIVAASVTALTAALATVYCLISALLPVTPAQAEAAPPPEIRRDGTRAPKPGALKPTLAALMATSLIVVAAAAADPAGAGLRTAQQATSPAAAAVATTGETTEVTIDIKAMRFVPDLVEVPAGNRLVINLENSDDQAHDLVLASGAATERISPGATATLDAGVITEDVEGWCSIAGHRQMGMVFHIKIAGSADTAPSPEHDHSAHAPAPSADFDLAGEMDPTRYRDPVLAPLPPASGPVTHNLTFDVTEETIEVAPGLTQNIWLFNAQMPGPTLHGRMGDTFVITLVNKGTMGHSIDFHAGALAPDEPMRTIEPGESLVYTFTATRSGIWMYHCSTAPMSLHIANGMYGAVVIEPPDLPAVDHSFVLVQGESYYGPDGQIADAAKIASGQHDTTHFNGYPNQYVAHPLQVTVGQRVRFWVLDAGVAVPLSFHIVGGQFDTVFKEGAYLLQPGNEFSGGSQALGLMAAEGGFVELEFPEAGTYTFVNHIMVEAERGAKGQVVVTK